MNDVFDEELIKELGLDPEDLTKEKPNLKKRPLSARSKPPVKAAAKPPIPKEKPQEKPIEKIPEEKAAVESVKESQPETMEDQAARVSKDIPVHLAAVIAKKSIKLKDILELKTGEVLDFKKLPQDPLDLVANGKLIAKAELVLIDGKLGARIIKLIK